MSKTPIPFYQFLSLRLRKYRVVFPLVVSALAGVAVAIVGIYMMIRNDESFLGSIAPHVALLIETNDRPELQRFISGISEASGSRVEIIHDGEVIASTLNRAEIGLKDKRFVSKAFDPIPCLRDGMHVGRASVHRPSGPTLNAEIRLYTALSPVAAAVGIVGSIVFALSWLTGTFLATRIALVARQSLTPVETLDSAVRALAEDADDVAIEPLEIAELENFRSTITKTRFEIKRLNDERIDTKAKELSELAYKRLIHDLHTPVTALRQYLKIAANERISEAKRIQARECVSDLAEQILAQVSAGKNNLALSVHLSKDADLRVSVRNAIAHAQHATFDRYSADIVASLPLEPVKVDHDPLLIGRVVSNLVTNAVESHCRNVKVVLETVEGCPKIKVADDGPGMAPEIVALHLVGRGKSTKADRNGYGLSSCNHIVRSHGGRIIYRALASGGSEFEISIGVEELV